MTPVTFLIFSIIFAVVVGFIIYKKNAKFKSNVDSIKDDIENKIDDIKDKI